jgi:RNA polymerase sigma factor (sigma-70 family)
MLHLSKQESYNLWKRYLSGEGDALESILRNHYNLLIQYGKKFTDDIDLVKDCIQNLFLSLWQNRINIHETPSVANYLLKALRNRLQRELSKNKNLISVDDNFMGFRQNFQTELSPEAKLILEEQTYLLAEKIKLGIKSLSKRQQEIIYLRFYLNASSEEISDIMEISRQSVYNLLNESIINLRKISEIHFRTILTSIVLIIAFSSVL